ncbi:MAG: hypothetical protein OXD29_08980 [Roseovarius sp.]|nr:hypothetical protein [Roseovarius sp.]
MRISGIYRKSCLSMDGIVNGLRYGMIEMPAVGTFKISRNAAGADCIAEKPAMRVQ